MDAERKAPLDQLISMPGDLDVWCFVATK